MAKYNVHFGIRLTYDVEVEAESEEEAKAKARSKWATTEFAEMDYADDDVDVWEVK